MSVKRKFRNVKRAPGAMLADLRALACREAPSGLSLEEARHRKEQNIRLYRQRHAEGLDIFTGLPHNSGCASNQQETGKGQSNDDQTST